MILRFGRLSAVLACLVGPVACDDRGSEEGADGFLVQRESALDAGGVVKLESNVLKGTVRLTNANPQVLALLASDSWIHGQGSVSVSSTSPTGFSASTSGVVVVNPSEFRFEMLVEAGAGGDEGVVYDLNASRGTALPVMSGVTVRPVAVQPSPTEVAVQHCIGVVRFQFGTDAACQSLATATEVRLDGSVLRDWGGGFYTTYVPGGASRIATLVHSISTPTGPVRTTQSVQLAAGCDEIVRACIHVGTPVPPALGGLTGAFEIHGETASSKSILFGGPAESRTLSLPGAWSPANHVGSWWTSPTLQVGSHSTYAMANLRSGRNFTQVRTPYYAFPVSVVEGPPMPLTRQVNGQTRHAYDMHPAYFYGAVHLADPFVRQHPGAWSSLQALYFEADHDSDGDGVPDSPAIGSRGTFFETAGSGGSSRTAFPGDFDANLGELVSSYEQVLPGPYDLVVLDWTQHPLNLRFWSEPTGSGPFTTRPGLYDPARFRYGSLSLRSTTPGGSSRGPLNPEQRYRINHEYCFSEVQIQYAASAGRFFNPFVEVTGSYSGRDWRNQPAAYAVLSGVAYGTPAVWNTPNPASYAQTGGQISLALPQGTFNLQPGAFMVSESGAVNKASFSPIGVTVGCGQRLKLVPPLAVSLASLAGCATSDSKQVSGQVKSRPAEVDRVWYRLNGGPEVTLCTDCGFDPTFSFNVPLQTCDNSIQVFAFTQGMSEPASSVEQLVWDDPTDGPSCPGSFCVNRPPVARCKGVIVPADSACSGCGSVNDGSFDPDPGDTVTCVQTPACPHPLGSHTATLTCTDSRGLTSSCTSTVTVRDETPPTLVYPAPIVVEGTGPAGATVTPGVATAADACGPPQVSGPVAGTYPVGTTPVTYTATDVGRNQTSCVSTLQVTEPPPQEVMNVTLCNLPRHTRETTLMACGWTTPRPGGAPVTQVSFRVDGGAPVPVTPDLSGGFVITWLNLEEGTHVVELTATDTNRAVTRKQMTVTVDLTPPLLAILSPLGDEPLSSPVVTVTSSVQDATPTRVTTQWLETSQVDSGTGTVIHTVDLINRGFVPLLVAATDAAGNTTQLVRHVNVGPAQGLLSTQGASARGP